MLFFEGPLSVLGEKEPRLRSIRYNKDTLGLHWAVEQLADLFHTPHRVKTQQVTRSRGQ